MLSEDASQELANRANELIVQHKAALECGPQCQRDKKMAELRTVYESKEDNVKTAPLQLNQARQNYLEFKYGKKDYIQKATTMIQNETDQVVEKIKKQWADNTSIVSELILDYKSMNSTNQQLDNYHTSMKDSIHIMQKNLGQVKNDTVINDRKAYYQKQGVDNLQYWYWILRWA